MAKKDKKSSGSGKAAGVPAAARADRSKKASKHPDSKAAKATALAPVSFSEALRVREGFILAECDPRSTPAFDGDKAAGQKALAARAGEIGEFQERLYAESKMDGQRSLLLVVQGMDTSGKGGIMRHVVGEMDPQGVRYTSFKAPSAEERSHPFLWRIRNALPHSGQVGVFDRSQYEDVLVVRVHDLVPRATWSRRYAQINAFEEKVVADGTVIVKVMMHISPDEQKARLGRRLARPDKQWKYNPGDVDERMFWPQYQEAYQAVLDRTSTDAAPWYVVPADRKWYARLAVQSLVLEHLEAMDPQWPAVDYDVAAEQKRLRAT
ncbi:polyphosphate kinase 2 family protein [Pedococcus ginsenosidimutans]|jgi:PPK2 family polyphosphate:nucleotide phosphotransferase|uniref:Polyphosphate kinase 2 family protein n=1 Tax=Pedococcus ginsenosidimutans TaxID=490570 RepID=A0ABP8XUB5_9MICO